MSVGKFLKSLLPSTTKVVHVQAPISPFQETKYSDGRELAPHDSKGMVKLGVIVGHTKQDPGATMGKLFGNLTEYAYNSSVAEAMRDYAKSMGAGLVVQIIYRDRIGIVGAYDEARAGLCDAVIELHFNAFNTRAKGTATLCSPDTPDADYAHIIHKGMCELFKREGDDNRGVQTISKAARGGINVHSFPGGVNCLVEPFFGDNDADAKMGMEMKVQYARNLVDSTLLWAKKIDLLKG